MFPTADLAIQMLESTVGLDSWTAQRFPTGMQHFVFDAESAGRIKLVVRVSSREQQAAAENAARLSHLLRPLGVPLPELIHVDLSLDRFPFPFVILERLPGRDLGDVYLALSQRQKRAIADERVRISGLVDGLPDSDSFGFAATPDNPSLKSTWRTVLDELISRAEQQFPPEQRDLFALADHVRDAIEEHSSALSAVEPRPFLHDTTTKNVIVHEGALSGIVDVDDFCFGDRLFTPALTWASLLARGWPADYVERCWAGALALSPENWRLLRLYAACFCIDLLGEMGQTFADKHVPANPAVRARLLNAAAAHLD